MVINTNTAASRGARFLADSTSNLQKSLARLSSGSKIVEPQDDAAGLAVASRFDAQINRTEAVRANIGNAISFKQTQDGYLSKVATALDRMSELATLAQDGTKTDPDRDLYNAEFATLSSYITSISTQEFNGVALFDGGDLEILQDDGGNAAAFTSSEVELGDVETDAAAEDVATAASADTALTKIKELITTVAGRRAQIGSDLSRLTKTSDHLSVLSDNLSASVSRIKDVDVAEESARYSKYNILVQSGTAMLAQANALPQSALRLLS